MSESHKRHWVLVPFEWVMEFLHPNPCRAVTGVLEISGLNFSAIGASKMIFGDDVTTLNAAVTFINAKGNVATVDGVPVWSLEGDAIGVVTPSTDGMTAVVALNGTLGTAQLSCKADADRSGGFRELAVTADIQIMPGEAVAGSINVTAA